jgi:hypothetical protein
MGLCELNTEHMFLFSYGASTSIDIDKKKESPCSSSMERKSVNQRLGSEEQLRPQGSMIYLSKASSYTRSAYKIGPPTWIKKEIKASEIYMR